MTHPHSDTQDAGKSLLDGTSTPARAVTGESCRQCQVQPGEAHEDGCGVARCMLTGQQRIQHDCADHCDTCNCVPCPPDIWTGEWPGVAECREFGWWCYFVPYGDPSWVPCGPEHPDAQPDLNRLHVEAVWDAAAKRWRHR